MSGASEIKAAIFDLDGVLVHTDQMHLVAWIALAKRLGICFNPQTYGRMRGVSRMESLDILLEQSQKRFTQEEKNALAAEKNESYRTLVSKMTPNDVDADVRYTLAELRQKGILLAVGSSSKNAGEILMRTQLGAFFDAVADGNDVARAKPDPEVFLKAAELLRVSPAQALVVEDAVAGITAARVGGFTAVALGKDAVQCPLSQYKLNRLSDLLPLFHNQFQL